MRIMGEQAAVEVVDLRLSKVAALVHDGEDQLQAVPDLVPLGSQQLVAAEPLELLAQFLGREPDPVPHVLGEHDEDQAVEQFLGEPYRSALGHPLGTIRDDVGNEQFAIRAVMIVEFTLDPFRGLALLGDQAFEPGPSCFGQQHVAAKQAPEQEAVELGIISRGKQRSMVKKIGLVDREAQVAVGKIIPPVEAEFVHVGDDGETRLDWLVAKQPAARVPEIIPRLHYRRTRVPLTILRRVEAGADILELAHDLGNLSAGAVEISKCEIGFALAAGLPCPADRKLGEGVKPLRTLAVAAVVPSLLEESANEIRFRLRFLFQKAGAPVFKPPDQSLVIATRLVVLEFVMQLGAQEIPLQ